MYETLITLFESPAYLSTQMAEDAGIPEEDFKNSWRMTEEDRTTGGVTVDEVIERILKANNCFTAEKLKMIMEKRIRYKREVFEHMHPEIIPLLETLKSQGYKIGLISNCHSEEAMVIRQSILFPYFDAVCLSYEEGIKKPDQRIFERCMERLCVDAVNCLYVGDGGSRELEAAREIGMHQVQAVWYLKEGTIQPTGRMKEYTNIENPFGVIDIVQQDIGNNRFTIERCDRYKNSKKAVYIRNGCKETGCFV